MHIWQVWCTPESLQLFQSLFGRIRIVCIYITLDFLILFLSQHFSMFFKVVSDFSSLNHGLTFEQQLPSISDLPFWIWMVTLSNSLFLPIFSMKPVCSSPLPFPLCLNEPLQCICQYLSHVLLPPHFFFPVEHWEKKCQMSTDLWKSLIFTSCI